MAPALGAEIFSRGFRFNPTPLEAATYYLPRLVACAPLHEAVRPVVHYAEVYASEPAELARQFWPLPRTGHRFFFSSCKKGVRVAGPGSWYLQSTAAIKDRKEAKIGEIKKFRYKKRGVFTDWLMDEISTCSLEEAVIGDRQFVFCKIYVSPKAAPDSAARQESAAFFPQPAHAPGPGVAITQPAAPKRPPPQSAQPPCTKRMRGAVAPTPPVVLPAGCTTFFAPSQPGVPHCGMTASSTSSVSRSPPPPTVPIHPGMQSGRSPPQQQMPLHTPPVVRACHMPVKEPARHYQPQLPVQTKQSIRHPLEAAQLRDEAEEERVAAADPAPKESPAAAQDFDIDEAIRSLESLQDVDFDELLQGVDFFDEFLQGVEESPAAANQVA